MRTGQHIPGFRLDDDEDLARLSVVTASSTLRLAALPQDGPNDKIERSVAQLIPLPAGPAPRITAILDVEAATTLTAELRICSRADQHTPDTILARESVPLKRGVLQRVTFEFRCTVQEPRYVFICFAQNERVRIRCTEKRVTGLLSVYYSWFESTSHVGGEDYEVWTPMRRPKGHNLALQFDPPVEAYAPEAVINGIQRPTNQANAWVAALDDPNPALTLTWETPRRISRIEIFFDPDYDHPVESALYGHPERAVPFCVKEYRVLDDAGRTICEKRDNHQARNVHLLAAAVETRQLRIEILSTQSPTSPAAIMEVRAYDGLK
jgi:hypothetical protein